MNERPKPKKRRVFLSQVKAFGPTNPLTVTKFKQTFLADGLPCVIRNGCSEMPAVKKWTFEFLKTKVGKNLCYCRFGTNSENYRCCVPTFSYFLQNFYQKW